MSKQPRIGFVVQRCGEDVIGGAEALALASAKAMNSEWSCEILTTCARDARTWANEFAAGPTTIAGVRAHRFAVDKERDLRAFNRISARVARDSGTLCEQEAWMREQGPYSTDLVAYLRAKRTQFDAVFFFSYLYATTYFGMPEVAERAILVPLAHDEWTLRLPLWDTIFRSKAQYAFVSEEERALVEARFPDAKIDGTILRTEVRAPEQADPQGFRERYRLTERFGVYVGRVDRAKGVDDLLERFQRARKRSVKRDLVLVGPATFAIGPSPGVHVLGPLPENEKWNAYVAADFAIVPSVFESLSIAALEAWSARTAVLANGGSPVLIGQCRRSGGGLWYANDDEFCELYETALLGKAELLGLAGARYVAKNFDIQAARASLREALEAQRMGR